MLRDESSDLRQQLEKTESRLHASLKEGEKF